MQQASASCAEGCNALCFAAAKGNDDMLGMPGGFAHAQTARRNPTQFHQNTGLFRLAFFARKDTDKRVLMVDERLYVSV